MANDEYDYSFKIVLAGDSGVGKSNIFARYFKNIYLSDSKPTIGMDFLAKNLMVEGATIKAQVWDTAGQDKFRALAKSFYKNASGCLLVYDITNYDSFRSLDKWFEEVSGNAEEDLVVLVIGNKCDLEQKRQVTTEEGEAFAKEHGLVFLETSAKTAHNVDDAFVQTAQAIYEKIAQGVFDVSNESFGIRLGTQQSASGPSGRAGAAKASGGCC